MWACSREPNGVQALTSLFVLVKDDMFGRPGTTPMSRRSNQWVDPKPKSVHGHRAPRYGPH